MALQSYVTVVQPDAAGADDDDEDGTVESVDPVLQYPWFCCYFLASVAVLDYFP